MVQLLGNSCCMIHRVTCSCGYGRSCVVVIGVGRFVWWGCCGIGRICWRGCGGWFGCGCLRLVFWLSWQEWTNWSYNSLNYSSNNFHNSTSAQPTSLLFLTMKLSLGFLPIFVYQLTHLSYGSNFHNSLWVKMFTDQLFKVKSLFFYFDVMRLFSEIFLEERCF